MELARAEGATLDVVNALCPVLPSNRRLHLHPFTTCHTICVVAYSGITYKRYITFRTNNRAPKRCRAHNHTLQYRSRHM